MEIQKFISAHGTHSDAIAAVATAFSSSDRKGRIEAERLHVVLEATAGAGSAIQNHAVDVALRFSDKSASDVIDLVCARMRRDIKACSQEVDKIKSDIFKWLAREAETIVECSGSLDDAARFVCRGFDGLFADEQHCRRFLTSKVR